MQRGLEDKGGAFKPAACSSSPSLKRDTHTKLCSLLYCSSHRIRAASTFNSTLYREFSLDTFLFGYKGHIKIQQLLFIACCCPHLVLESLELCMKTIVEETTNFDLYNSVFEVYQKARIEHGLFPLKDEDLWSKQTQKIFNETILELQNELKSAKSNRIKESIRLNHIALGEKHFSAGLFRDAISYCVKSKEACSNEAQLVENWFNYLRVAAAEFNLSALVNATTALGSFQSIPKCDISKLQVANGLTKFMQRRYAQAVHHFLEVDFAANASVSEILPLTAMVLMVVLAFLAYSERRDIKKLFVGNTQFKGYLDLEPGLRELIKNYLKADYPKVIRTLEERRGFFLLNLFIGEHFDHLFSGIKRRIILDYFKPFKSACLIRAAKELSTTVPILQAELGDLILEGLLSARMDLESKVLWSKKVDPRPQVLHKVQSFGQDYQRHVRITLGLIRLQQAKLT